MTSKTWTATDIRSLARQTVDGRNQLNTARGAYLRALIETAQAALDSSADHAAQLAALKAAHKRFYPIVREAIATDEIIMAAGFARKDVALERNRRTNFARSSFTAIKRWMRDPDHDLMALPAAKTSKSKLESDAPPAKPHAMTRTRAQKKAAKLIGDLLGFTKLLGKIDEAQAREVLNQAIVRLTQQMTLGKITTDASVATAEGRPLRVGKSVFVPAELPRKAA